MRSMCLHDQRDSGIAAVRSSQTPDSPVPPSPLSPRRLVHSFPWDPTGQAHLALALQRRSHWLPSLRTTIAQHCMFAPNVTDWGCRALSTAPEAVASRRGVSCRSLACLHGTRPVASRHQLHHESQVTVSLQASASLPVLQCFTHTPPAHLWPHPTP